ncbi:MAG TPA: PAS domain-containing protein, partial [Rhizomicrobium sp.]
ITSFEVVALDALESAIVKQGAAYWNALRGTRRYPARRELRPRGFASILPNTLLVRVVDGGADFEFRIVGEAQAQTYALPFAGKRLSEFAQVDTAYCYVLKGLFGHVAEFGEPVAVRGNMGSAFSKVRFSYCESIFLPLGESDGAVDHLIGFSAYVPRDFSN